MDSFQTTFGVLSSSVHGIVVSAILIGGMISGVFAGNLADIYGRIQTIVAGAIIFGIGATLECAAPKLGMFIAGRVIAGLGEGLFLGTLVVYICEIAPARRRGPLASLIQMYCITGVAAGYFIAYGTARISDSSASWRTPLAFHALVAFSFALACLRLPPSPRWLMSKHRTDEAMLVLERLGLESMELERMATRTEEDLISDTTFWASVRSNTRDMTRVFSKRSRKQTGLACFLMAMQQFSGIDGVLYYAPLLFRQAGLASGQASFLASGVSALAMLVATIPASYYTDKLGRRVTTIGGGIVSLKLCTHGRG